MPGRHITDCQTRLYMKSRQSNVPAIAAAKAGFSTASAYRIEADKGRPEMTQLQSRPPAPVGQQAPPARAAASAMGARRAARGSLLLTTGTASHRAR